MKSATLLFDHVLFIYSFILANKMLFEYLNANTFKAVGWFPISLVLCSTPNRRSDTLSVHQKFVGKFVGKTGSETFLCPRQAL